MGFGLGIETTAAAAKLNQSADSTEINGKTSTDTNGSLTSSIISSDYYHFPG